MTIAQRLEDLLQRNRTWAQRRQDEDPQYFQRLSEQQRPSFLWIGWSDSRLPPNEIVGMEPGEVFVHRNVANLVHHTDVNALSVLQYAVEVLEVSHIIVCGHYGCGGVRAAMENRERGLLDHWLRSLKDVYTRHEDELGAIEDPQEQHNRLCELNVGHQVDNICHTPIVQNAWRNGRDLTVSGWIYGLHDGLVRDMGLSVTSIEQIPGIYRMIPPHIG